MAARLAARESAGPRRESLRDEGHGGVAWPEPASCLCCATGRACPRHGAAGGVLAGREIAPHDGADERAAEAGGPAADLSSVQIHRPGGAFPDPRLIGARAYTVRDDIVVGRDLALDSPEGRHIVEHELVHVEQARSRGDDVVRRFVWGDLETTSIGEDFARDLTEDDLEQAITYLQHRRMNLATDSIEYEVAVMNLEVLILEANRRGYQSPAVTRLGLLEMLTPFVHELKRVVGFMPHFEKEFRQLVSWVKPWAPHPAAWGKDPIEFANAQFNWMVDALTAAVEYMNLSIDTQRAASLALLEQAGIRISSAMLAFHALRPLLYFVQGAIMVRMQDTFSDPRDIARPADQARESLEPVFAALDDLDAASLDAIAPTVPQVIENIQNSYNAFVHAHTPFTAGLPMWAQVALFAATMLFGRARVPSAGSRPVFTFNIGGMVPAYAGFGAGGATAIVITAEQIAVLKQLVAVGAVSSAVLVAATSGTSFATGLPPELVDLLGKGPTTGGMSVTGKTGAGMQAKPKHHVMPQEERAFFEQRGMRGDLDIDNFTVRLEQAEHQAIHGGGNWRLGRTWPGEWNQMIMTVLRETETRLGRMLRPNEILDVVAQQMGRYGIPMRFTRYR